jgi:hypothetical protein
VGTHHRTDTFDNASPIHHDRFPMQNEQKDGRLLFFKGGGRKSGGFMNCVRCAGAAWGYQRYTESLVTKTESEAQSPIQGAGFNSEEGVPEVCRHSMEWISSRRDRKSIPHCT